MAQRVRTRSRLTTRGPRGPVWLLGLAGLAAAAFVLLIPVMLQGNSWQQMVAAALLFVPSFGLLVGIIGVVGSL